MEGAVEESDEDCLRLCQELDSCREANSGELHRTREAQLTATRRVRARSHPVADGSQFEDLGRLDAVLARGRAIGGLKSDNGYITRLGVDQLRLQNGVSSGQLEARDPTTHRRFPWDPPELSRRPSIRLAYNQRLDSPHVRRILLGDFAACRSRESDMRVRDDLSDFYAPDSALGVCDSETGESECTPCDF